MGPALQRRSRSCALEAGLFLAAAGVAVGVMSRRRPAGAGAVSVMAVTAISMTDAVQPDQLTADEIRRLMMGTLHQERLVRSDGPYEEVCGRAATRKPIT
jgi:hypothetical protein